jgi:hypothetical protein
MIAGKGSLLAGSQYNHVRQNAISTTYRPAPNAADANLR